MNAAIILGQILSSVLYIVMRTIAIYNNYENSQPLYQNINQNIQYFMMFELPISMIAALVSISLIYLYKMEQKNLRPDFERFAENQMHELMDMDDGLHDIDEGF